jgi:hypothetical protein
MRKLLLSIALGWFAVSTLGCAENPPAPAPTPTDATTDAPAGDAKPATEPTTPAPDAAAPAPAEEGKAPKE